jgi:hypothetical protein
VTLRIIALIAIYIIAAMAWVFLGATVALRTEDADRALRKDVGNIWGTKLQQQAPVIRLWDEDEDKYVTTPLASSDIDVAIDLEHRRKGLLWYATYQVGFEGRYTVSPAAGEQAELEFKLPDPDGVYDNFHLYVNEQEITDVQVSKGVVRQSLGTGTGKPIAFRIAYQSQGMGEWWYELGDQINQVRNFKLVMRTDFDAIDFPEHSRAPLEKTRTDTGWTLTWQYDNLLSGLQVGMVMPEKLNPGPWVQRVTWSAPVSLALFFFLVFIIAVLRGVNIHPVNYFFIACGFFAYHLLLAYLVDHINIHLAFWICSAVSIFLVVSYMRLVTGMRFATTTVGLAQLVYLVLFSYTFFFRGFTGLAITVMAIITLFIVMQATGRVDWEQLFKTDGKQPTPPPDGSPMLAGAGSTPASQAKRDDNPVEEIDTGDQPTS